MGRLVQKQSNNEWVCVPGGSVYLRVSGNIYETFQILIIFIALTLQSCQTSSIDNATKWTQDIKEKVIEDANQQSNKTIFDSARSEMTIFKGNKKLKYFYFKPAIDDLGKPVFKDTAISIFYSADQNFELVRELCPASDRSFEGIKYKDEFIGLSEFKYCGGQIKESGFRYHGDIGTWTEFDSTGKTIKETDKGHVDQLKELQKIKYYR